MQPRTGSALRPHIKTHKSPRIAGEQLRRGAVGLTCATPFEAEVMSEVCDDMLVAYPPVGARRAARLAALPDRVEAHRRAGFAQAIEDIADGRARGRSAGLACTSSSISGCIASACPSVDAAIALARLVTERRRSSSRGSRSIPGTCASPSISKRSSSRSSATRSARRSTRSTAPGLHPGVVSGGSTPTLWHTHEIDGVTEFRPGTYVYNDRTTAAIGACDWDDCALTVLATVVSTAVPGQAVIDAGSKSLGREPMRGTDAAEGFGCLLGRHEVSVKGMSATPR